MNYVIVSSSTVDAVGYEDSSGTLGVRFLNGTEYEYFAVPKPTYLGLVNAASVGSYLDQNVKKAGYSYRRVR